MCYFLIKTICNISLFFICLNKLNYGACMNNAQFELNLNHLVKIHRVERKIVLKLVILISFILNIFNLNMINFMPFGFLATGCLFIIINLSICFKLNPPPLSKLIASQNKVVDISSFIELENNKIKTWVKGRRKHYFIAVLVFLSVLLIDANLSAMNIGQYIGVLFLSMSMSLMVFSSKRINDSLGEDDRQIVE